MAQLQMGIPTELLTSNLSILVLGLALLAIAGAILQRLLKWAVANGCPFDARACTAVAREEDHLAVAAWCNR